MQFWVAGWSPIHSTKNPTKHHAISSVSISVSKCVQGILESTANIRWNPHFVLIRTKKTWFPMSVVSSFMFNASKHLPTTQTARFRRFCHFRQNTYDFEDHSGQWCNTHLGKQQEAGWRSNSLSKWSYEYHHGRISPWRLPWTIFGITVMNHTVNHWSMGSLVISSNGGSILSHHRLTCSKFFIHASDCERVPVGSWAFASQRTIPSLSMLPRVTNSYQLVISQPQITTVSNPTGSIRNWRPWKNGIVNIHQYVRQFWVG